MTMSSIAAIPMSLTEQQRHPFGRLRNSEVVVDESGSDIVRLLDSMSVVSPKSIREKRDEPMLKTVQRIYHTVHANCYAISMTGCENIL